jgi:hypothetical protein
LPGYTGWALLGALVGPPRIAVLGYMVVDLTEPVRRRIRRWW